MLDDKKKADLDQSDALMAEILPGLWTQLFKGCLKAGCTEEIAIRFVCAYIVGATSGGIRT